MRKRRVELTMDPAVGALGFGLGARPQHYDALLGEHRSAVEWLEALTENYLVPGGKPLDYLTRLRAHYPIALHGVSLSIGGVDPLDRVYLDEVKTLAARIEPVIISDHLCWTGVNGVNLHDLLPLPFTLDAARRTAARVARVQEHLGRRLLIENVSSYVRFAEAEMSEWEFISEVVQRADCLLLLDVNNVYVSSVNHGFDPLDYLRGVPAERVRQIHLAGGREQNGLLIDTHDAPVPEAVWRLYGAAIERFGSVATMIERDANIPPLADLLIELDRARRIARQALAA